MLYIRDTFIFHMIQSIFFIPSKLLILGYYKNSYMFIRMIAKILFYFLFRKSSNICINIVRMLRG